MHLALAVHVDCVDTEAIDATFEPEDHGGLIDGLAGFFVFPVQVRLLGAEEVEIVLLCVLIPFPDATCEVRDPVVGGLAFAVHIASWAPDVPIALRVVFRRAGFKEPLVLNVVRRLI
jgi:hypothetical protein